MSVTITVTGNSGAEASMELITFVQTLQQFAPTDKGPETAQGPGKMAAAASAKERAIIENKAPANKLPARISPPSDDEDEAPVAKKPAPNKAIVGEDEDDVHAPKKKPAAKAKPAAVEDEEEEAPAKKKKPEANSSVKELVDDGEEQDPTVTGCRIMIRRVARAKGCGTDHAQAILAEFGVSGAASVPDKKMQAFIDRCQEVIDEPDSIEVE
jgi:hypothetical protein